MEALIGKNLTQEETKALSRSINSAIREKQVEQTSNPLADKTNLELLKFNDLQNHLKNGEKSKKKYGKKERDQRMTKLKKLIKKRTDKIIRNGSKQAAAQRKRKQRNTKKIAGMKVTPKIAFKKIPVSLNQKSAPLDSSFWQNTHLPKSDPRMTSEISQDIYKYLRRMEVLYKPKKDFLSSQAFIKHSDRCQQIDWILRLCHEMRLRRQTFYLCVSIIDRYAELVKIDSKDSYDLLSLAGLFMAAKYEELTFPTVKDFVFLSGGRFSVEKILGTEVKILETLGWRMNDCNPMVFFDEIAKGMNLDPKMYHFSQFVVEALIYKGVSNNFKNSILGVSSLFLTLRLFRFGEVEDQEAILDLEERFFGEIEKKCLYRENEIVKVARVIWKCVKKLLDNADQEQSAIVQKFRHAYYSRISKEKVLNENDLFME
jgi:hypothetical protein